MSEKTIGHAGTAGGADVAVFATSKSGVSIRVLASDGRLSYLDVPLADLPTLLAAVSEADLAGVRGLV